MVTATSDSQTVLGAIEALLMAKKQADKRGDKEKEREKRVGDVSLAELESYLRQAIELTATLRAAQRMMADGRFKHVYMDGRNRPKRGFATLFAYADDILKAIRNAYRESGRQPPPLDTLYRIVDAENP